MKTRSRLCLVLCGLTMVALLAGPTSAERFHLMFNVDRGKFPGADRTVVPTPFPMAGVPGNFNDGDRLAGTSDVGPDAAWMGLGTPIFGTNQFGALSFLLQRGSVPIPTFGQSPIMGVQFLAGPLLDLDGNLGNETRSLVPVPDGNGGFKEPALIPESAAYLDLAVNTTAGTATLINLDATGTINGGPNIDPDFGVTITTLAGTADSFPGKEPPAGKAINPSIDTRNGTVTSFSGQSGLSGVYRIDELGFEFWNDSISGNTSTPALGTFQFLGTLRGWLVERHKKTGSFPSLAGEGLGSTTWPAVNASQVGNVFTTATGFGPPFATIASGTLPDDNYTDPGNGGVALTDFGGDLGGYLDFIASLVDPAADRFVYLESAGFGINNSFDPVFLDTVGYDVILIAQDTYVQIPEPATIVAVFGPICWYLSRRCRTRPDTTSDETML